MERKEFDPASYCLFDGTTHDELMASFDDIVEGWPMSDYGDREVNSEVPLRGSLLTPHLEDDDDFVAQSVKRAFDAFCADNEGFAPDDDILALLRYLNSWLGEATRYTLNNNLDMALLVLENLIFASVQGFSRPKVVHTLRRRKNKVWRELATMTVDLMLDVWMLLMERCPLEYVDESVETMYDLCDDQSIDPLDIVNFQGFIDYCEWRIEAETLSKE